MEDRETDLATILDDVKTIKSILQTQDAPLPELWKAAIVVSPAILLAGLLQYFVPFFRNLDFDGKLLWLWVPGVCAVFPVILAILYFEIRRTGKGFLGQSRIRHLLFARFIIPPAAVVLVWVSSRNAVFPTEGVVMLVAAMWQTAVEQALPPGFRPIPFVFLTLGLVELGFRITGPEPTLFNVVMVSAALGYAGFLFRIQSSRSAGGR